MVPVAEERWGLRIKQSGTRHPGAEVVWVRGNWLYGKQTTWNQPAEVAVGDAVKRIKRVFEKDQRKRVPGEAVLQLYGITTDDVPVGAVVRGPGSLVPPSHASIPRP
jgi:hypothetical protein